MGHDNPLTISSQYIGGNWVQTSYNGNIRKNYAGIGFTYSPDLDAFIPPKPDDGPAWVLDTDTAQWRLME